MHYHCTDLGYLFVADFRYWLLREALIFARFLAAGMGVSSYVGQFICEYIL